MIYSYIYICFLLLDSFVTMFFFFFSLQSVDLDMKHDCKQLMERINVFKTAFSENEDDER